MKKNVVRLLLFVLFPVILLANCPTGTTPSPPPDTILISGFAFVPSSLTVSAGTTVHWINQDAVGHTVTSDPAGPLGSGTIGAGGGFDFTFTLAGDYPYRCTIHQGMTASVTVTP